MLNLFSLKTQALRCYQYPRFCKIAALALLMIRILFFELEITDVDVFWHTTEYCFKNIARKMQIKAKPKNNPEYF